MYSVPKNTQLINMSDLLRYKETGKLYLEANVRDQKIVDAYTIQELDSNGTYTSIKAKGEEHPEYQGGSGVDEAIEVREFDQNRLPDGVVGKFQTIKGHRRTVIVDMFGRKKIPARVFQNMNDHDFYDRLMDHGTHKGLSYVELYNSIVRCIYKLGLDNEGDIAYQLRGQFEKLFNPGGIPAQHKEALEKAAGDVKKVKAILMKRWRNTLQCYKFAAMGPVIMEEQFINFLAKKQMWPKNEKVRELYTLFRQDIDGDADLGVPEGPQYNRDNPGPRFMEEWNKLLVAVADSAGEEKIRETGMKKRKDIETFLKRGNLSAGFKAALKWVLSSLEQEKTVEINNTLYDFEKDKTDVIAKVYRIMNAAPTIPTPPQSDSDAENAKATETADTEDELLQAVDSK